MSILSIILSTTVIVYDKTHFYALHAITLILKLFFLKYLERYMH